MNGSRGFSRVVGAAAVLGALAIVPISLTPNEGSGFQLRFQDACAQPASGALLVDGSCAPQNNWICGLNGQNYQNHKFVPADE